MTGDNILYQGSMGKITWVSEPTIYTPEQREHFAQIRRRALSTKSNKMNRAQRRALKKK